MKYMYDIVSEETESVIKKDQIQELEEMEEDAAVEAIKFFCSWSDEKVANIRRMG